MPTSWSRRSVLCSGSIFAALGASAPAVGQDLLRGLLQSKLPEPLRALLPPEAQDAAQIVTELLRLEDEAKLLRLPASPLNLREGAIPSDPDRLYEAVMPRLVALVDRADRLSPTLADKAAGLLAHLHRSQYDAPDAWFGDRVRLDGLQQPMRPLRIANAAEPEIANLPSIDLPSPDTPPILSPTEAPPIEAPPPPAQPAPPLPPIRTSLKFTDLADEYSAWFAAASIRPEHQASADWHLAEMRTARPRYQAVGQRLGVPWHFIAAIHGLEASFNFRAHLHNGDFPLSRRTRQVPANRPSVWLPPSDWGSSAVDALRLMGFAGQQDWSLPRTLYRLEAYNGFGYRRAGRVTPYLWSFSNHFWRGKFVADGRFDPKARSQQCGAAVMLKVLEQADELRAEKGAG